MDKDNSFDYMYLYKRMYPYVKPYLFRAIVMILISIPLGALEGVLPLSLKYYQDNVIIGKNYKLVLYIPLAIILFAAIQGILKYITNYLGDWVGRKITNDVKIELFNKLLRYETAFFDKNSSGFVMTRFLNDADAAANGIVNNIKTTISRAFSTIAYVGVMLYTSWQLAIVAVTVLITITIPLAKIRKLVKYVSTQGIKVSSAIVTHYNETFAGNKIIASYNLDKFQSNRFNCSIKESFDLSMKLTKVIGWLTPLMNLIASIGIAAVLWYGSHLILTGALTQGEFMSFIAALVLLYTPVKTIGNTFADMQSAFVAMNRVFSVLDYESKIQNSPDAMKIDSIKNSIKFQNVWFEYEEGRPVLKDINLDVKIGETIAFVGNSGGGKTTLVNLIPRFYDILEGSIKIDEIDIRNIELASLRDNIAIVFQDNFLFDGSIRENILLGKFNATEAEIAKAVKDAHLDEFIASIERGLDTRIGERGVLLSGGQKQRVAIARAMIKNAPVVILDEATSALDNKSEAIVQQALDKLMVNRTVFVIAHRLSTVQNATRIVVIDEGRIIEVGNHEELMNRENGVYKNLYYAQFKQKESQIRVEA